MSDDESSFVILGSTPTPSMEQYNGHDHSMTKENASIASNVMQSSGQTTQNFSLVRSPPLSIAHADNNVNGDSLGDSASSVNKANPLVQSTISTASGNDFAEQFLLGEIPADSLKYNIWKHFPSFCTNQSNPEDIEKLEGFINEHVKLKENLQKTNEAMRQHFSAIDKWQTKVKELKETQASEIAQCNERNARLEEQLRLKVVENENLHLALLERDEMNQKLKLEMARIKEEHEEKTLQFNMNLAYASGENNDLVQEVSAKNAIIQNMTNMIEKLEKQLVSFEMVSIQRDGLRDHNKAEKSLSKSHTDPAQESIYSSMQESQNSALQVLRNSSLQQSQGSATYKSVSGSGGSLQEPPFSPLEILQGSLMEKSASSSGGISSQEPRNSSLQEPQNPSMQESQGAAMEKSVSGSGGSLQRNSSLKESQGSFMEKSVSSSDFAAQLNAARQQNLQLLEDVSNKITTIKRLENESSKLQHQLLSLEMIVNENGQNANEEREKIRQLKDELNQISIQNIHIREVVQNEYVQQIDELKESLAREQTRYEKLKAENNKWIVEFETQRHMIAELTAKVADQQTELRALTAQNAEQQTEMTEMQKANVLLRSKEINADIYAHEKEREIAEIKEENEFLKAQLDVYKSDFEMERQSRQDIANEREELLSDLKLLQRRNQQLIEEAQSRTRTSNGASTSATASAPPQPKPQPQSPPVGKFICPVCNNPSPNLMTLQNHVQNCLEN